MPAEIRDLQKALPALLADANKTLQKEHVTLVAQGHLPEAAAANDSASDGTEASALLDDGEADPSAAAAHPHSAAAPRQEEQSTADGFVAKREPPPREAALQCQEIDGPSWRTEATEPDEQGGSSGSESEKVPTPAAMRTSASTASLASLAESASLIESASLAKGQESGASGAAPGKTKPNLSVLHACMHCRAAKTACTDCRPCKRCTRLGLQCAAYRDEPRKRACQGCHTAKVACGVSINETCARCRRLGSTCVPRDAASARNSVRKRKRPVQAGALPLELLGAAQAAALELSPMGPRPIAPDSAAAGGLMGLLHLAQAAATEERYRDDRGAAAAAAAVGVGVGAGAGVGVDVGGSRLAGVEGAADEAAPQNPLEISHSFASAASTVATD